MESLGVYYTKNEFLCDAIMIIYIYMTGLDGYKLLHVSIIDHLVNWRNSPELLSEFIVISRVIS